MFDFSHCPLPQRAILIDWRQLSPSQFSPSSQQPQYGRQPHPRL